MKRHTETLASRARAGQLKHTHLAPGADFMRSLKMHDSDLTEALHALGELTT
jgi:hypothetical protein